MDPFNQQISFWKYLINNRWLCKLYAFSASKCKHVWLNYFFVCLYVVLALNIGNMDDVFPSSLGKNFFYLLKKTEFNEMNFEAWKCESSNQIDSKRFGFWSKPDIFHVWGGHNEPCSPRFIICPTLIRFDNHLAML